MSVKTSDWNSFSRANAMEQWRRQSAMMGNNLTEALVRAAAPVPRMKVLDVACGSGEPAITIATQLEGTGEVIGIDISDEPIKVARERAASRDLTSIKFEKADAHNLPYPDQTFDLLTSRLGIMFFDDIPRAFREFHRVLKPGARAAFACWGPMQQPYFDATAGVILAQFPNAIIPEAARKTFQFGKPGKLETLLRASGFHGVEEDLQTLPWVWHGTPEQFWEYFQAVTIPVRELLELGTDEQRRERDIAVLSAVRQFYDGQKLDFTATFNITTAVRD